MAQEDKNIISRYKIPLLIIGAILVVGLLGVGIFGFIISSLESNGSNGQTNPSLVDSASDEIEGGSVSDQGSGLQVRLPAARAAQH